MSQRIGILAVLTWLGVCSAVHAAPVEQVVQLAFHPTNSDVAVVRYASGGNGLFFTSDGGTRWRLLCGTVIEPGLRNLGRVIVTGDGRTAFGIFGGVVMDDATGCGWSRAPELDGKWITDIINDPLDPTVAYAVSSNGDPGLLNGIYRRDAATGSWVEQGTQEPVLIGRVLAVPTGTDTLRFYQSIGRLPPDAGMTEYYIRYSDDGGESWTEHYYGPAAGQLRLEAIDPTDIDRLVVGISNEADRDTVLISQDAGATFTEYVKMTQLGAGRSATADHWMAFAPDGQLWIGDAGNVGDSTADHGLWHAENLDTPPTKILDEPINCVHYDARDERVWLCSQRGVGTLDPRTGGMISQFSLPHATHMLECPERDIRAECADQLGIDNVDGLCAETHFPCAPVCARYEVPLADTARCCGTDGGVCLVPMSPDAGGLAAPGGMTDPGADPDGTTNPSDDCSCSLPGGRPQSSGGGAWPGIGLLMWFSWRRRQRGSMPACVGSRSRRSTCAGCRRV